MLRLTILLIACAWLVAGPAGAASEGALHSALQRDLEQYLTLRSKAEHISAVSLSVSLHGEPDSIDITVGHTEYGGDTAVTSKNLWQIGSNTKAFTAAAVLQLEAEGKLTIDQTVGRWLPQYPAWKNVTIRRLLNMTSGIPSYDNVQAMQADYARHPKRELTESQLIAYVYPGNPHAPAATSGYSYSNTNFILGEMIVERATGHTFASEVERRFLRANLGLDDTYYAPSSYPAAVLDRMVAGYFYNHGEDNAGLAPLLGRDVSGDSVSWMQSAGAIVSTPRDVTRWARALYTGKVLAPKQQDELTSLVSVKTGRAIVRTSLEDPRGFGLGIAQMTMKETGTVWFYEGMTLGYRMVHVYFPRQDVAIAFGLNSQPDDKQNNSGKLAVSLVKTLREAGKL